MTSNKRVGNSLERCHSFVKLKKNAHCTKPMLLELGNWFEANTSDLNLESANTSDITPCG